MAFALLRQQNRYTQSPMLGCQMVSLYIYKEKAFQSIFYGDSLWVSVESMTILSKGDRLFGGQLGVGGVAGTRA